MRCGKVTRMGPPDRSRDKSKNKSRRCRPEQKKKEEIHNDVARCSIYKERGCQKYDCHVVLIVRLFMAVFVTEHQKTKIHHIFPRKCSAMDRFTNMFTI